MPLDDPTVITTIMQWRQKLTAAAWLVTHDRHASDDIFQTIVLKAITTGGTFEAEASVVAWSFVTCRHASIDWLRRRKRETAVLEANTIARLHDEWAADGRPVMRRDRPALGWVRSRFSTALAPRSTSMCICMPA